MLNTSTLGAKITKRHLRPSLRIPYEKSLSHTYLPFSSYIHEIDPQNPGGFTGGFC